MEDLRRLIPKNPNAKPSFFQGLPLRCALSRKKWYGIKLGILFLKNLHRDLMGRWYIFRRAFRSFLGHIDTQYTINSGVYLGETEQDPLTGNWKPTNRTLARMRGRDTLRERYVWADIVDLHVFLMGFDLGAEFQRNTLDKAIGRTPNACR